jgi:hypothetical protein
MFAPVSLRDAPSLFLDPGKWAELRSFASNDLIALTYVNAQYPDKNDLFGAKDLSRRRFIAWHHIPYVVQPCRIRRLHSSARAMISLIMARLASA